MPHVLSSWVAIPMLSVQQSCAWKWLNGVVVSSFQGRERHNAVQCKTQNVVRLDLTRANNRSTRKLSVNVLNARFVGVVDCDSVICKVVYIKSQISSIMGGSTENGRHSYLECHSIS